MNIEEEIKENFRKQQAEFDKAEKRAKRIIVGVLAVTVILILIWGYQMQNGLQLVKQVGLKSILSDVWNGEKNTRRE